MKGGGVGPRKRKRNADAHPDHGAFVETFDSMYRERVGSSPTWNGKTGKFVRDLLKAHGLEKCIAHAMQLFTSPPRFLRDATPDLATLVQHFDKLAPSSSDTRMSAQQVAARAKRMMETE